MVATRQYRPCSVLRLAVCATLMVYRQYHVSGFHSSLRSTRLPPQLLSLTPSSSSSSLSTRFKHESDSPPPPMTMLLRMSSEGNQWDDSLEPSPGGGDGGNDGNDGDKNNRHRKRGDDDEGFGAVFRRWLESDEGRDDIQTYFLSLAIALLLRFTIIEPRYIPSLSMFPTFDVGDQLAVEKVTKRLKPLYRQEVVVFNPPQSFRDIMVNEFGQETSRAKEALIKRVVAIEGDEVEVRRGNLFVNGDKQDEPYTNEDANYEFGPVVVPKDCVLVLGDNRNHSLDGHIWGFLPKENVIGRAVFVYWPPWRLGNTGMY